MGLGYAFEKGELRGRPECRVPSIPAALRTLEEPQDSKVPAQSELPSVALRDLCSTKIRKTLMHQGHIIL